jgi:hypothetical protein
VTRGRFADRGWFVNDRINLRTDTNRQLVAAELQFPNIAFGLHRWFAAGSSPDLLAIATPEQWEAELARGRPGDNLMLLSLRRVAELAVAHVGGVTNREPLSLDGSDLVPVQSLLADDRQEITVIHRFSPQPDDLICSYKVQWDLKTPDWDAQIDEWSAMSGELWFFNNEIIWQEPASRVRAAQPPEEWTAQHGMYLVDGYLPDQQGRVVSGGPY